nr:immunoglobulin heavy chain junction region [Macaca mulatta]
CSREYSGNLYFLFFDCW